MSQENQQYEIFQKRQKNLLEIVDQQLSILEPLEMKSWKSNIQKVKERILSERFKVVVMGEFKRGKSTFINALLKQEVLPAKATPCTAIIHEVKWGESPKGVLHFIESEDGSIRNPQEVSVKEIKKHTVIKIGQNHKEGIKNSPYKKLELFWPLELCKNGVEIIDSPGLNEHEIRQKITTDYLSTVDAILFVLSCEALASKSEIEFIHKNLIAINHEEIFFICNRFDIIKEEWEKAEITEYAINRLAPLTKLGKEGIFFISAKEALEGYLTENNERVQHSGVPPLKKELEKFLATQRGRLKIIQPSKQLKNSIYEARRTILERKALLQTDLKTLEERYEAAQRPLGQLEKTSYNIIRRISNFREDMKDLIRQRAQKFYYDINGKIEDWVEEYEVQEGFGVVDLIPGKTDTAIQKIIDEVNKHISEKIDVELNNWQNQELKPFLESRLADLKTELDTQASKFLSQADQIRLEITGEIITNLEVETDIKRSPIERILAAAGALLFVNIATAGAGLLFGFEEMVKGLMYQIGAVIVTTILFGSNPVVLAIAIFAGSLTHGAGVVLNITKKIKKEIVKKYKQEFHNLDRSDEIATTVAEQLGKMEKIVEQGLTNEIQSITEQVKSILKEKEKGQKNVDKKLRELEILSKQLNQLDSELDELIAEVALP